MFIRTAVVAALLTFPTAALAVEEFTVPTAPDQTTQSADPATPADPAAQNTTGAPAQAQDTGTPGGGASLLGPESGAASTETSGALQPAGTSALQSTTGDSTGLTAPSSSVLQGSAPSGELRVLLDSEADGGRQGLDPADETTPISIVDILALLALFGLGLLVLGLRRRVSRRFAA